MDQNICVFCSSSQNVAVEYFEAAEKLGIHIAERGDRLIYGGARIGLMGQLAKAATAHGAHVTGIIPQKIHDFGVGWPEADEYIVTADMHQRKAMIEAKADAFIALPGGFGTLEEVIEVITLKQLGYHNKPILLLNIKKFFEQLLEYFEQLYSSAFAGERYRSLYYVADDVEAAYDYLENYTVKIYQAKWL